MALVTVGLAGAGAVAGALVAIVTSTLVILVAGGARFDWVAYAVTGVVGAACGVLLGPAIAWLLLRSLPIGPAILQASIGAAIGGVLAWLFSPLGLPGVLALAALGGLLAALRLRYAQRRRRG